MCCVGSGGRGLVRSFRRRSISRQGGIQLRGEELAISESYIYPAVQAKDAGGSRGPYRGLKYIPTAPSRAPEVARGGQRKESRVQRHETPR